MLPNGEGTVISRIDPFSKWKMTAEPAAAGFQLWVLASSAHAACFSFCEYKTTGCSSAVGWTCQEATISSAPCTVTLCGTLGQSLYCIFFSKVVFLIEQQWMNPITNLLRNYWNSLNPNIVPTRVDHCGGSQCWIGDGLCLVRLHYVDGSEGKLVLIRALLSSDSMLLGWVLSPPPIFDVRTEQMFWQSAFVISSHCNPLCNV